MDDFSDMDTSIYWNQAKKYLPAKINTLFIAESPPAFKDQDKMSYFYFKNNYRGEILFATITKALFNVNYHKDPERKKELLERFRREKRCFLVDGVPYPINRDGKWRTIPAKEREAHIRKNKEVLLRLLSDLKKREHIDSKTRLILIKKTVYNALYDDLKSRYYVLNEGPIGFPRWYRDPTTVSKIRKLLGSKRL